MVATFLIWWLNTEQSTLKKGGCVWLLVGMHGGLHVRWGLHIRWGELHVRWALHERWGLHVCWGLHERWGCMRGGGCMWGGIACEVGRACEVGGTACEVGEPPYFSIGQETERGQEAEVAINDKACPWEAHFLWLDRTSRRMDRWGPGVRTKFTPKPWHLPTILLQPCCSMDYMVYFLINYMFVWINLKKSL